MIWFNVEIEAAQTKTQKQLLNLVEYRQIKVYFKKLHFGSEKCIAYMPSNLVQCRNRRRTNSNTKNYKKDSHNYALAYISS